MSERIEADIVYTDDHTEWCLPTAGAFASHRRDVEVQEGEARNNHLRSDSQDVFERQLYPRRHARVSAPTAHTHGGPASYMCLAFATSLLSMLAS